MKSWTHFLKNAGFGHGFLQQIGSGQGPVAAGQFREAGAGHLDGLLEQAGAGGSHEDVVGLVLHQEAVEQAELAHRRGVKTTLGSTFGLLWSRIRLLGSFPRCTGNPLS